MQNAQNADIQRVINLVELYRTKVGKESDIAKAAKEDYDFWNEESMRLAEEDFANGQAFSSGVYGEGPHTETWIKHLMVNEQLLGHFYAIVAGDGADNKVLEHLLPDLYDTTVFTLEEESYLIAHFRDMVNYIIQTPCNDLEYVHRYDSKDRALIPHEVLSLIQTRINLPVGSTVYNPFAGFGQFASCFHDCQFYCEESYSAFAREWNDFCDKCYEKSKQVLDKEEIYTQWAWLKVALFAANPKAKIIEDSCAPSTFDAMMAFIPVLPKSLPESTLGKYEEQPTAPSLISKIREGYKNLKIGGDMVLIVPNKALWDAEVEKPFGSFWEELLEEHAITEVVQLPSVMSPNLHDRCCVIMAKKGNKVPFTNMIDLQFAVKDISDGHQQVLDIDAIYLMLNNGGKDSATGLRKLIQVPSVELNKNLLFPQLYVVERPNEDECPCPLSEICMPKTKQISDVDEPIHGDIPLVKLRDLSATFQGTLDISKLDRINEPREEYVNITKCDELTARLFMSKDEYQSFVFRRSIYVDGNNDVVVFYPTEKGIGTALLKAGDTPIAIDNALFVLQPQNGMDAESLLAILNMPIVWRQLNEYKKFGLCDHLDDIIVPTDKRVLYDYKKRLLLEEKAYKTQIERIEAMKAEYLNEVRMRKHDMGQKVFDLINTEDLMRFYVENRETESDLWPQMDEQLNHFRSTIHELSEMLDHLSQEEQFGLPELIDLDEYLRDLQHSNIVNGFTVSYHLDRVSFAALKKSKGITDDSHVIVHPTVRIAKNDIQRVVSNILGNAKKHGFTDASRMDYELSICLSFNSKKGMYQIDFRNNGQPLPEGLNKMRYGIKGEKAGRTAGTGLGGNIVRSIVEHYKGDYDIFMDGEWTVVRLYLPIMI